MNPTSTFALQLGVVAALSIALVRAVMWRLDWLEHRPATPRMKRGRAARTWLLFPPTLAAAGGLWWLGHPDRASGQPMLTVVSGVGGTLNGGREIGAASAFAPSPRDGATGACRRAPRRSRIVEVCAQDLREHGVLGATEIARLNRPTRYQVGDLVAIRGHSRYRAARVWKVGRRARRVSALYLTPSSLAESRAYAPTLCNITGTPLGLIARPGTQAEAETTTAQPAPGETRGRGEWG
jgi:hypothetical protein